MFDEGTEALGLAGPLKKPRRVRRPGFFFFFGFLTSMFIMVPMIAAQSVLISKGTINTSTSTKWVSVPGECDDVVRHGEVWERQADEFPIAGDAHDWSV